MYSGLLSHQVSRRLFPVVTMNLVAVLKALGFLELLEFSASRRAARLACRFVQHLNGTILGQPVMVSKEDP